MLSRNMTTAASTPATMAATTAAMAVRETDDVGMPPPEKAPIPPCRLHQIAVLRPILDRHGPLLAQSCRRERISREKLEQPLLDQDRDLAGERQRLLPFGKDAHVACGCPQSSTTSVGRSLR